MAEIYKNYGSHPFKKSFIRQILNLSMYRTETDRNCQKRTETDKNGQALTEPDKKLTETNREGSGRSPLKIIGRSGDRQTDIPTYRLNRPRSQFSEKQLRETGDTESLNVCG